MNPSVNFDNEDITVIHTGDDLPAGCEPGISTFQKSTISGNRERYTFTVTPRTSRDIVFTVGTNFQDLDGNKPVEGTGGERTTKYNGPVIYAVPEANAGPDQLNVTPGTLVTLAGSGTTDDCLRSITGYTWTRTSGTANLSAMNVANPTFTADALDPGDADATHVFSLIVTDDAMVPVASAADTVTVTVTAPDDTTPPTGMFVSVPNIHDGKTTFEMTVLVSEPIRNGFSSVNAFQSTFTEPNVGQINREKPLLSNLQEDPNNPLRYTFDVTPRAPFGFKIRAITFSFEDLSGNQGVPFESSIIEYNMPPVANAGMDQTVASGARVTLEGSGSDDDGIASWFWERTDGTGDDTVTLTDEMTAMPGFTAEILTPGATAVTHIFELVVTDKKGIKSDPATVTVTVLSPLVANAGDDQSVGSGATVTLRGSGSTVSDSNRTVAYAWERTSGTGTDTVMLSDKTMLEPTFTADTLMVGDTEVTHIFTLTVTDNRGSTQASDTVTVTVTAPTLPALTANAGLDKTVASEGTVTLDGSGTANGRSTELTYFWERTGGTTGGTWKLSGDRVAQPTFTAGTLMVGDADVTHIFTLTVEDDEGSIAKDMVTITVVSPLDANAGDDQSVDPGDLVTLDGSGTESDSSRTVTYAWTWTAGTGTSTEPSLSNSAVLRPTFTAAALAAGAADVIHIYTLTITDNRGSTQASDSVRITVAAPPAPPPVIAPTVANAGPDQTVASGATVMLDGSGSTKDPGTEITYFWERTSGTGGGVTFNPRTAQPTFTADRLMVGDAEVTHIFTLSVEDDSGVVDTDMVTITVVSPLDAKAGDDQSVGSGATVTLRGTGSTVSDSNRTVTYNWERTSGTGMSTVMLSDKTMLEPTFTADTLNPGATAVTHIFTLTVTDNRGSTQAIDTVMVTVTLDVVPPVANAGPDQTVDSGKEVTLDGRGSTVDSRRAPLRWSWTQLRTGPQAGTGGRVMLSNQRVAQPTFTPPSPTPGAADPTYVFSLTVRDIANQPSIADTVKITVTAPFANPVAKAGSDQRVVSRATVTLDGRASTKDRRRTLTHRWLRAGGTGGSVTLSDETEEQPTFIAETLAGGVAEVTYTFSLTVTDSAGVVSAPDTVTITVIPAPFPPPVANAGPDQSVLPGTVVRLDGGATTIGRNTGNALLESYNFIRWRRIGGTSKVIPGLTAVINEAFQRTFTAQPLSAGDDSVTHIFELWVQDQNNVEDRDTVTITVLAPLVADAGPDQPKVRSGTTVTLDGSGSTPTGNGRIVSYAWADNGDDAIMLDNATGLNPTFVADTLIGDDPDVTYVFTLTVTDDAGSAMASDTVTITITDPFDAPVANAGDDQTVDSGKEVTLDGSGSTFDDRGSITSYIWTRTSGTGGTLTDENTVTPTFTAQVLNPGDTDATHVFELMVTDDAGQTSTDTVTITVTAPPFPALVAEAGTGKTVDHETVVDLVGTGSTVSDSNRTITYAWARTGGTGDSSVAPVNPAALSTSFTTETLTPGTASVTHIFTLTVTDNQESAEASDTVTFTVNPPPFPALVAEAGTGKTVDHETVVDLVGTGSTVSDSNRTITYAWARTGGTGDSSVAPVNPAALSTSFTTETLTPGTASVTHIFTLTVTDNQESAEASDTVTFTVNPPPFPALVAEAGTGKTVDHEAVVDLVGTGSTVSDSTRTITYAWARTGGTGDSSVAPSDPAALSTSFTTETLDPGDAPVTHIFTLTVTDNQESAEASDTVTFTVNPPPFPALVAEAGTAKTVDHETVVDLVGTGSTVSDSTRTITYAWARTGGTGDSSVAPSDPAALVTSFTSDTLDPGDTPVTHIFTLTVTDNQESAEATDTVTFTVNPPPFPALVAEAGTGKTVDHEAVVDLVGTGSTVSDSTRTITYAWARTGGTGDSSVAPSDPAALSTSFTTETLDPGDAPVTHIFTLTVTDNQESAEASDTVTFTVNPPPFPALVAEAGTGKTVDHEAVVDLVGTGSTVSDSTRTITYAWARTGGTGDSSVAPSDPAALVTSFTSDTLDPGDTPVTHIFTLTVTDNQESAEATDTVTFTVNPPPFPALVAEAGTGKTVDHEAVVDLVGTGSTVSDSTRTITYAWARTGGTGDSSVTPLAPAALSTSFTTETLDPGDAPVTHIFTLTVTDNQGSDAATAMVTFTVNAPDFDALVAVAGTGGTVSHEAMVPLVGTGSTVSDSNRTITYAWARTGGTGDSSVTPLAPAALSTSFTTETLDPGDAPVNTVTDNQGSDAATAMVTFTVNAPDFDALVAVAGTGGTVSHEAMVPLVGTGSTVSDSNRTITYAWARTLATVP